MKGYAQEHQQYSRKLQVKEVMNWEQTFDIDEQQRATEWDLMAMNADDFNRYRDKAGAAYRMRIAEDFKKFVEMDQKTFRDQTKADSCAKHFEGHDLNITDDQFYELSDEENELDMGESDDEEKADDNDVADDDEDQGEDDDNDNDNGISLV